MSFKLGDKRLLAGEMTEGAQRGLENDLEGSLTSSAAIIVGKEPEDAKQQEITRRICQHNQLLFSLFFGKFIRSREHLGWPGAQV